ncbi:IPT/TIG domain-containing protein [Paludibaculum fermentans]|uniref:IPT/TIG domain-containing protein n=1 Tax=Paludibaculum fermentans TaxID=1473598 RepID=A0A7S7NUE6_PALFE|nr:IPT/TIG domain-containing protein [Paludibaculum fermentans]QOY89923.1 IPT/TIG domain-containing protein [Paludibaculum fermentans]
MRFSLTFLTMTLLVALAAPPLLLAQDSIPRCTTVEPASGKVGTEFVVTGENLSKDTVAKLYLTDGTADIEIPMSEQTATTIKAKIPNSAKVGERYKLMILTKGKEPKLIEQPVRFEIE